MDLTVFDTETGCRLLPPHTRRERAARRNSVTRAVAVCSGTWTAHLSPRRPKGWARDFWGCGVGLTSHFCIRTFASCRDDSAKSGAGYAEAISEGFRHMAGPITAASADSSMLIRHSSLGPRSQACGFRAQFHISFLRPRPRKHRSDRTEGGGTATICPAGRMSQNSAKRGQHGQQHKPNLQN